jgi:hypothetical protein
MSLRVAAINYRATRQKRNVKNFWVPKGCEKTMGMKLKNGYTNYEGNEKMQIRVEK